MAHVIAFQIASQIQIKEFRKAYAAPILAGDSAEIFYNFGEEGRFAVFEYGVFATESPHHRHAVSWRHRHAGFGA